VIRADDRTPAALAVEAAASATERWRSRPARTRSRGGAATAPGRAGEASSCAANEAEFVPRFVAARPDAEDEREPRPVRRSATAPVSQ